MPAPLHGLPFAPGIALAGRLAPLALAALLAACEGSDFLEHRPGVQRVDRPAPAASAPRASNDAAPARQPMPVSPPPPPPRARVRSAPLPPNRPPASSSMPAAPAPVAGANTAPRAGVSPPARPAAPPPPPSGPRVLAGNATSVAVGPVSSLGDKHARERAGEHCRGFDRRAVLPRMSGEEIVLYQCAR